jgi:GTP pyrophosphokinase
VVEDTDYSIEDIRGIFGEKVAAIIDGLTKIKGIFDYKTSTVQAENFRKVLLTLSDDVRVILIKLADRLHNMRTLDALTREKQLKVAWETTYLYAPLAHRLGLHTIKSELEDLALKYTEPEVFNTISRKMSETSAERKKFFNSFIRPIKRSLNSKGFVSEVTYREKSKAAIWQKMKTKQIPLEEVYDIFAVRIVIETPFETEKADCWKVYSAITDLYPPNMERLRDWISIPKANGYEALHTTVMSKTRGWVEIQIRSRRMDEIAEKGYAAHWKYKQVLHFNSRLDNWLDRIREMIVSPQADALSFLDDVKGYFFLDEISVFTPQGELRTLPAGSSVLDLAYAIHSELGNSCIGAKVDKKLVPSTYKLANGQQVEILTSPKQTPKEDWLNHVMTTRAKSNIKFSLRIEKKKYSRSGKEKLTGWFNQIGLKPTHQNFVKFLTVNNFSTLVDLYYAAARDKIGVKDVKLFAASNFRDGWINYISNAGKVSKEQNGSAMGKTTLAEPGTTGVIPALQAQPERLPEFQVADCCNPIPGDDVIGLMENGKPIQIHRGSCTRVAEFVTLFGQKLVQVDWNHADMFSFMVEIKITGIDKKGLINEITRIISTDLDLNIKSLNIDAVDGITVGKIILFVHHLSSLNDVMDRIGHIEGIEGVERVLN